MAAVHFCYEVSDHNISGKDTSKHPFDDPKHMWPQCEYTLQNRTSKIVKNAILTYFYYLFTDIVDFCLFPEDMSID